VPSCKAAKPATGPRHERVSVILPGTLHSACSDPILNIAVQDIPANEVLIARTAMARKASTRTKPLALRFLPHLASLIWQPLPQCYRSRGSNSVIPSRAPAFDPPLGQQFGIRALVNNIWQVTSAGRHLLPLCLQPAAGYLPQIWTPDATTERKGTVPWGR
jgi:hypothetical protein